MIAVKTSITRGARGMIRTKKNRVKVLRNPSEVLLSPVQKEIQAIVAISGLKAAVQEMNEINQRHSGHPVVQRLLARTQALTSEDQETLSKKFLERLSALPAFDPTGRMFPAPSQMTEEEARKMADAFVGCFFQLLGDMGVSREDQELLRGISDEVMRPINDLMQLYLKPKTFSQKMKRVWRMQRIFLKVIKLIHLTKVPGAFETQSKSGKWETGNVERKAGSGTRMRQLIADSL